MDIQYKIKFYSDWNCGSGLAAGADVDLLPVKDADGLPFVPGKTMKGLVREALESLYTLKGKDEQHLIVMMGKKNDAATDGSDMKSGCSFFMNAVIPAEQAQLIVARQLQPFMFRRIASTSIDKDGVAKDHSLRKIQVAVPCELEGSILDIPETMVPDVTDALRFIKRLGSGRNRGLGRCDIEVLNLKKGGKA